VADLGLAAEALAQLMPNAKVERIPDAGHSVDFERTSIFRQW